MSVTLPVIYSQFTDKWAKALLGNNTEPQFNFYNYGCVDCSQASMLKYYGKDEDPMSLNQKLISVDGFINGGEYIDGSISKIYPDITEKQVPTPDPLTDAQLQEIKQSLDAGYPVMVKLDYNPKTLAPEFHYLLLVDYNPNDENDFTVADSLGGRVHPLKDYLAAFRPNARVAIEKYFIYQGPLQDRGVIADNHQKAPDEPQQEEAAKVGTSSDLPANYADIVHGSTQWDEVARYLELEKLPNQAFFEDAKRVIAGLKSAKTDYNNKQIDAEKKSREAQVIIDNQNEDIRRLKAEVIRQEKLHKADVSSLKQNIPSFETIKKQYDGVIKEMGAEIEAKVGEIKQLRIAIAHKDVELDNEADTDNQKLDSRGIDIINPFKVLLNGIKHFLILKW